MPGYRIGRTARRGVLVAALLLAAACGDDGPREAAATTTLQTASPTTRPGVPSTAAPVSVTTTEPRPVVPEGEFVAVVTQNRTDVVENRFQIQLANRTHDQFRVVAARLLWDGFSSDWIRREPPTVVVGGQRVDIPSPFPGANCAGDGPRATMPSVDTARVELELEDGDVLELPVVDEWFIARRLYEEDCERQMIESLIAVEWVDVDEDEYDGRPVTVAEFRLTRRTGVGEFTVLEVGNTIPYVVEPVLTAIGEPVVTLAADADQAGVPMRIVERRCDAHAMAEVKQPTNFATQIRFPDGSEHTYIAYPDRAHWLDMRDTADRACEILGEIIHLGK